MVADRNLEGSYALFVLPAILLSALVVVVPAILTILASLTEWDGVSQPYWVGLDNFAELLGDSAFWQAVFNNVRWMVIFLTIPMTLALVASSILLNRKKAAAVYQIILLIPFVLSPVANTGIWLNMVLDVNSGVLGYINRTWMDLGYPLGNLDSALYTVAAVNIWSFWGYLAVIFTAAMRQTPEEQLEAAYLEGANAWQIFVNVTFPNILPTFSLMFVIVTIYSFLNFDYVYLMTGGGPAGSTEMLSTLAYSFAFRTFEVGKAAAVAIAMSFFGLLASFVYVWLSRESLR
ncbi:sugar ABC transporter permease [Devosia sp.]|uniref:carbohydrate ABC transporter permease n=1 Tax=Devosia sp. TaxID=1871048 RepID=UPI0025BA1AAC|nr:sugar ABC transporter permease [Devosia sp.]